MRIEIKHSITFLILLTFSYVGAMMLVWYLPLPKLICFGLNVGVGLHFVYCLRKYVFLKSTSSVKSIAYHNNRWLLETSLGNVIPSNLQDNSFSSQLFFILYFKALTTKKPIKIILFNDSCDTDSFRQLRVKLVTS